MIKTELDECGIYRILDDCIDELKSCINIKNNNSHVARVLGRLEALRDLIMVENTGCYEDEECEDKNRIFVNTIEEFREAVKKLREK